MTDVLDAAATPSAPPTGVTCSCGSGLKSERCCGMDLQSVKATSIAETFGPRAAQMGQAYNDEERQLAETLPVPVIASGGGGVPEHFVEVLGPGKADAALAASIFHFREITIPELKGYLQENGVAVRL